MVPYYKYSPDRLLQKGAIKMYWDQSIIMDHTVRHNRPDITIKDFKQKKETIIDIAILKDYNIGTTVGKKLRKCMELVIEIKESYHLQNTVVWPIIFSTNGIIPQSILTGTEDFELPLVVLKEAQQALGYGKDCKKISKYLKLKNTLVVGWTSPPPAVLIRKCVNNWNEE